MAHFAITDVSRGQHRFFERISRGAAGLAGAEAVPYRVWLEDWRTDGVARDGSAVRLRAAAEGWSISLDAAATKPLARHGDRGLSQKSEEPGNASYYVGYTRMEARGQVAAGGTPIAVRGQAWFDHEWSTSALGAGAVGWDWFSLQMSDGRELMFFQIRREDGTFEPASAGTVVNAAGDTQRLGAADVAIEVLRRARSPSSGATYPTKWRIKSAAADMDLDVESRLDDQELRTSFTYWEGAVSARGTSQGRPVEGGGYVEMTGYARSMRGVF